MPDQHEAHPHRRARSPEEDQTLQNLESSRLKIAGTIERYFRPLFFVTLGFAIVLIALILVGLLTKTTTETIAIAASVQVAFGMVIGFACVYIGLMMTWFGIEAFYSLHGKVGAGEAKGDLSLKSASPGLLFALGGIILIAVSLYKPIHYKESGNLPTYSIEIKPMQPPPIQDSSQPQKP